MIHTFRIPLVPTAQMRARASGFRLPNGKVTARTHKAAKQKRHEEQLMQLLAEHAPEKPIEGAISITILACFAPPKSKPQWWKDAAIDGLVQHIVKPDVDNLEKHMLDCMKRVGFFMDDTQIYCSTTTKAYAEKPHWTVSMAVFDQPRTKKELEATR